MMILKFAGLPCCFVPLANRTKRRGVPGLTTHGARRCFVFSPLCPLPSFVAFCADKVVTARSRNCTSFSEPYLLLAYETGLAIFWYLATARLNLVGMLLSSNVGTTYRNGTFPRRYLWGTLILNMFA